MSKETPENDTKWISRMLYYILNTLQMSSQHDKMHLQHDRLFDSSNKVPPSFLTIAYAEIKQACDALRAGKNPQLRTIIESQGRVFIFQSTETDSTYSVTIEIENNITDGKPRRRGTKAKQTYTFEKGKYNCKETTSINMEGEEDLVITSIETFPLISKDRPSITQDGACVLVPKTNTEFSENQRNLIQQVFGASQKPEHLGVLAIALREGLAYKHYKFDKCIDSDYQKGSDCLLEQSMHQSMHGDNILFINYQHRPNPIDKHYETTIEVTTEGTTITTTINNVEIIVYSSYEEFIKNYIIGAPNYLDALKSTAKKLQELGVPFYEGQKRDTPHNGK